MVKNQLDEELYPPSDSETADVTTPAATDDDDYGSDDDSLRMLSPAPSMSAQSNDQHNHEPVRASKSQFSASKWDLLRVTANRFTYSKQYIIAYVFLTLLSMITVAISLAAPKGCPHFSFYIFEIVVLAALMLEVTVRIVALRRFFWKSWWNILDAALMVLCAVTLGLVFAGCSEAVRRGRQSSTVLLVIRNIVQIIRIINLLWRNRNNISNRQIDIDLDHVEDLGFELLPEEEEAEQIWSADVDDDRRDRRNRRL